MKKKIEHTYGKTANIVFKMVNPIKKRVKKTSCVMHKLINYESIEVMRKCGFFEEEEFFKKHLKELNRGVVWADQDFRSINHFYHYNKKRGIYGFSNAYLEFLKYYSLAKSYISKDDYKNGIFYLGAACHLVQDLTIPQHVNNRLLKQHRKFELWVIDNFSNKKNLKTAEKIVTFKEIDDFALDNVKFARRTYDKYKDIDNVDKRFLFISEGILERSQSSTAGLLVKFYNEQIRHIQKLK